LAAAQGAAARRLEQPSEQRLEQGELAQLEKVDLPY